MIDTQYKSKWTEGQRMQDFFRLKAKEGNSGFAIAYALTLVAHKIVVLSDHRRNVHKVRRRQKGLGGAPLPGHRTGPGMSDEMHRLAFELEAITPGDD
jgi:hypothetical protein